MNEINNSIKNLVQHPFGFAVFIDGLWIRPLLPCSEGKYAVSHDDDSPDKEQFFNNVSEAADCFVRRMDELGLNCPFSPLG